MKRSLQLNPDNRPATWAQIKYWRDKHEVAPVETSFGIMDCDNKADKRLSEQAELFASLETLNEDGTLEWKMADNTWKAFTREQLVDAYYQVRVNRARRSGLLHVKAAEFKAMQEKPSVKLLKRLDYWLS